MKTPDNLESLVRLDDQNYAVILPNKILLITDASEDEIASLVKEERQNLHQELLAAACIPLTTDERLVISLLPTLDCNLRCVYCYARGGDDKIYMTKEIARGVIDAAKASSQLERLELNFAGGGEPFMNFGVMQYARQYAGECFSDVDVSIVTNGTFNDDQFYWLQKCNASVRISCDGVAHGEQRGFADGLSSQEIVEHNIKQLVDNKNEFMVQCIVTSKSVMKMVESTKYFADLGAKTIKFEPAYITDSCRGEKGLTPSPVDYVRNFIRVLDFIRENKLEIKIDTSYFSRPTSGYYCGVYGENIIVTPSGDITACVEIARNTDPYSNVLIYGTLSIDDARFVVNEIAKAQLQKLHFSNYSACMKCELRLVCRGGCPMQNIFEGGFSLTRSKYTCQIEKLLIPKLFSKLIKDVGYGEIILDNFVVQEV